jgi:hypothetical protein
MSIARVAHGIALLLSLALVACAEHPSGEAKAGNDVPTTPEHEGDGAAPAKAPTPDSPATAGESCGDVACESSSDCCKGYSCGFDPERSHVQRYCLGQ